VIEPQAIAFPRLRGASPELGRARSTKRVLLSRFGAVVQQAAIGWSIGRASGHAVVCFMPVPINARRDPSARPRIAVTNRTQRLKSRRLEKGSRARNPFVSFRYVPDTPESAVGCRSRLGHLRHASCIRAAAPNCAAGASKYFPTHARRDGGGFSAGQAARLSSSVGRIDCREDAEIIDSPTRCPLTTT